MKVAVAPDSFKESVSSVQAADAIGRGLRAADADLELALVPMADGGEGTVEAMVAATAGRRVSAPVHDPLGRPAEAEFGLLGGGRAAVIEMASASGLALLRPGERDPWLTSTRGTGELIRAALDLGVEEIIIGIGGSATVDLGTGMAHELGIRFIDAEGEVIEDCRGGRLKDMCRVDASGLDPRLEGVGITVACDVTNPLTGPQGAARVYGPQKGADAEMVSRLEAGMASLAEVLRRDLGKDVSDVPGAGAAGGLGAGLMAFLGAEPRSGAEAVIQAVRLAEKMRGSDLVITGEGRADGQSAFGKAPAAVARVARAQGVPTVMLCGARGDGYEKLYELGVRAVLPVCDRPMALESALKEAATLLERAAESVMRLWQAASAKDRARA